MLNTVTSGKNVKNSDFEGYFMVIIPCLLPLRLTRRLAERFLLRSQISEI